MPPRLAVIMAGLLFAACSQGRADPHWQEDRHYLRLKGEPSVSPAAADARVPVQEFFWYGCPHCRAFDPDLNAWAERNAGRVILQRVPVTLGHTLGEVHARAYFLALDLGALNTLHPLIFQAIHDRHQPLNTVDALRAFFERNAGVKPAAFDAADSAPRLQTQLDAAQALARRDGITAVPAVVVNGRYATNGELAGSLERMLEVLDALVGRVQAERPH